MAKAFSVKYVSSHYDSLYLSTIAKPVGAVTCQMNGIVRKRRSASGTDRHTGRHILIALYQIRREMKAIFHEQIAPLRNDNKSAWGGGPEAMNEVFSRYAGYIRYCSHIYVPFNVDMKATSR